MSVAFLFPGQGSQSVGMLAELANACPQVEETFAEASEVLHYDLWHLVQSGPESELNQTDKTQPAMLAAGVATWRAWSAGGGGEPAFMAGHSLGEYSALVCAGAIAFQDAVRVVEKRGQFMQQTVAVGEGAMAAILGLSDDDVLLACDEASQGDVVQAVNFNAPGQVVVAGHRGAVERAIAVAKEKGAKRTVMLPVSVPSHCALMQPAAERLAVVLADIEIRAPRVPVIHNADVSGHDDAGDIRKALTQQLYQPVRWVETIEFFVKNGVTRVVEAGPGKVLSGLNRRIDRSMTAVPVFDSDALTAALGGQ